MISKKELSKKIKEEFNNLSGYPISNFGITTGFVDENNILVWQITLLGAGDTSYKGSCFYLKIVFSEYYPKEPPVFYFLTPIYHPDVISDPNNQYG